MCEPHLHGGDGFTVLHVKEFILLDESIDLLLFDVFGTLMEVLQCETE